VLLFEIKGQGSDRLVSEIRKTQVDSVPPRKAARAASGLARKTASSVDADQPPKPGENTRSQILVAAAEEFAAKGLAGARVDAIAKSSGCNKGMLYYFFKSKEDLYLEVLESMYADMRRCEHELDLAHLNPSEAIHKLVEFKFDYLESHPLLIRLLIGENLNDANYLKRSKRLRSLHLPLVDTLSKLLRAGAADGTLRPNIDPVQLYITISALSYFYFSNAATLATAFEHDLLSPASRAARREHAVEVVFRFLLVNP
jgi:AcrR family transcriptional regulator